MRNIILSLIVVLSLASVASAQYQYGYNSRALYGGWASDPFYVQYPPRPVVVNYYGGGYYSPRSHGSWYVQPGYADPYEVFPQRPIRYTVPMPGDRGW